MELARRLQLRARLGLNGDARVGVDGEASRVSAEARSGSAKSTGFERRLWRVSGGSGGARRQRCCNVA